MFGPTRLVANSLAFFERNGTAVDCGPQYVPGEALTARPALMGSGFCYLLEVTGGHFDKTCDDTRCAKFNGAYLTEGQTVFVPTNVAPLTLMAAFAYGIEGVHITPLY